MSLSLCVGEGKFLGIQNAKVRLPSGMQGCPIFVIGVDLSLTMTKIVHFG